MKRIRILFLAGILALTSSCQGKSPHPGKSIGIEGFAGAKDLVSAWIPDWVGRPAILGSSRRRYC
jgi:hypothetical protein